MFWHQLYFLVSPVFSISSVLRGYCNGENQIKITAKSQIIEQIVKSGLTIALVEIVSHFNYRAEVLAAFANIATTIATLTSLSYLVIKSRGIGKNIHKLKFPKENIKDILKRILQCSVPITLCSIFAVLGKNIDSITVVNLLKKIIGEKEAIIKYGILSSKVEIFVTLPLAFNNSISTALIPEISKMRAQNNIIGVVKKIKMSILISLIICVPYSFGIFFYSNEIFELLFPKAIMGAELLKIASVGIVFSAVAQIINSSLQGLGKNNIPLYASICGIILKTLLNIILIPIKNIYEKGAIISSVISNIISFAIVYRYLNQNIHLELKKLFLIIPFVMSLSMIILSNLFGNIMMELIKNRNIITILIIIFS